MSHNLCVKRTGRYFYAEIRTRSYTVSDNSFFYVWSKYKSGQAESCRVYPSKVKGFVPAKYVTGMKRVIIKRKQKFNTH